MSALGWKFEFAAQKSNGSYAHLATFTKLEAFAAQMSLPNGLICLVVSGQFWEELAEELSPDGNDT